MNGGDSGEGTNGKGRGARAAALVGKRRFSRTILCLLGHDLPFETWSSFLPSGAVLDSWLAIIGQRQTEVGTLGSLFAPGVLIRIVGTLVFIALDDDGCCFGGLPSIYIQFVSSIL